MKLLRLIILAILVSVIPLKAQEVNDSEIPDDLQLKDPIPENQVKSIETTQSKKVYPGFKTEGIVIRGRAAANIEKAGTTTGVTAKDIEERSNKLLKDVLYQVPGIQVATERKGTTKFSMRGYDMSKIAILIDGIPVIDAFGGSMDIDNIGLMDISEIVVSRGSSSALYGTRGVAGSINLIKSEPSHMYTNISAEYGEHMNYVAGISHGAPIGNFYYYISGSYDKSNGYEISKKLDRKEREKWLLKLSRYDLFYGFTLDDIYKNPGSSSAVYYLNDTGLWDHIEHEKYKVNGKAGYHITPDLEIGVSSFYNYNKMENSTYHADLNSLYTYTGYKMHWQKPTTANILSNISSRWPESYDYAAAPYINYRHGKFRTKANIYFYEQSSMFMAYADPQENVLAYNRDVYKMTWSIWTGRTYGFNIYPSYELAPWNKLNFALSYYNSNHMEEEQAYNDQSTETISYYGKGKYEMLYIEAGYLTVAVEDEMRIMNNTELTFGVSYDMQDLVRFQKKNGQDGNTTMMDQYQALDDSIIWGTRDSFNPVAGVVYEPLMNFLKLRAAASGKTSFPTLQAYTKSENWYKESYAGKDANIKSEKSFNGNTGFELSFFDKQLTFGSDYFYSKYDDKIVRIYITRLDDYIYRNIDSAVIHGAETTLKSNIQNVLNIADVDISLTYTYIFARNQADIENSFVNKGNKIEKLPEHKFTFDVRSHFKTDTSLILFGYFEKNQILYTMRSIPLESDAFSTSYFYAQKIHDPLMIDIKLSQRIYYDYEVYVMCKNILDDYAADPFNPGPGRMFYFGAKAGL